MSYALLAICIISALCCIGLRAADKPFWGMTAKYIASLAVLALAVVSFVDGHSNMTYFLFAMLALFASHTGDVFLGIKEIAPHYRTFLIPVGIACFLVCHIFLSIAFQALTGFFYIAFIIGAASFVATILAVFLLKFNADLPLKLLISVYAFAIAFMFTSACNFYAVRGDAGALLAMIGALLFLVSDINIALLYFKDTGYSKQLNVIEIATYFAAQALIAISVMFV